MAKRANPYIEDYVQQSKVHVGVKQINNKEGRLLKVYELCNDDIVESYVNLKEGIGQRTIVCSAYLPGDNRDPAASLVGVVEYARKDNAELLICCDANAHHTNFGSTDIKKREKTLELLFKGAKKSYNCPNMDSSDNTQVSAKDKLKQLFIGKDGTLEHAGPEVKGRRSANSCACGLATLSATCSYCEMVLCGHCSQTCLLCVQPYCQRCAISESEGTAVCVSCYR